MREGSFLICGEECSSKCKDLQIRRHLVCSKNSKEGEQGRVECTTRKVFRCEDGEAVRGHIRWSLVSCGCILRVMHSHRDGCEWSEQVYHVT